MATSQVGQWTVITFADGREESRKRLMEASGRARQHGRGVRQKGHAISRPLSFPRLLSKRAGVYETLGLNPTGSQGRQKASAGLKELERLRYDLVDGSPAHAVPKNTSAALRTELPGKKKKERADPWTRMCKKRDPKRADGKTDGFPDSSAYITCPVRTAEIPLYRRIPHHDDENVFAPHAHC